jgi:hypothetical protein
VVESNIHPVIERAVAAAGAPATRI